MVACKDKETGRDLEGGGCSISDYLLCILTDACVSGSNSNCRRSTTNTLSNERFGFFVESCKTFSRMEGGGGERVKASTWNLRATVLLLLVVTTRPSSGNGFQFQLSYTALISLKVFTRFF